MDLAYSEAMEPITAILSAEHRIVLDHLDELEGALTNFSPAAIRKVLHFFDGDLVQHRRKEEEVLFPELAGLFPPGAGPVAVMLAEHVEEKGFIAGISSALATGNRALAEQHGRALLPFLRNHIWKEDNVLYPMAEQVLSEAAKAKIRSGFEAIGTFAGTSTRVTG